MKARLLGTIVVAATLVVGGALQPIIDNARSHADAASTAPTAAASSTAVDPPEPAGIGSHPVLLNTSTSLGNPDAGELPAAWTKGYGPVDQSAPLDFKTQPKTVPRNYQAGQLYNVQVYKKYDYAGILNQMQYFSTSLGVQCTYCHNVGNFAYDTPTKRIARTMALMTNNADNKWISPVHNDYPNYKISGQVGCITCHAGKPRMDVKYNVIPVQYLEYNHKTTKQVGYAVNSMYSAAKSLGVNCLFCHNSADFLTLQYYPTNQIATRMWKMVDDINHRWLPPNVKAVTCYTCHQGNKWPQQMVAASLDQTPVKPQPAHPEVHENPGAHTQPGPGMAETAGVPGDH
jgi:hypothetical protein